MGFLYVHMSVSVCICVSHAFFLCFCLFSVCLILFLFVCLLACLFSTKHGGHIRRESRWTQEEIGEDKL